MKNSPKYHQEQREEQPYFDDNRVPEPEKHRQEHKITREEHAKNKVIAREEQPRYPGELQTKTSAYITFLHRSGTFYSNGGQGRGHLQL